MPSFNQVVLMGNVTRDLQLKYLPNQTAVVEFGMAMNRKWRTPQGEDREEVCFVDCVAFGKQAETLNQYVTKGKPLFLQGRLRYEAWEDKQGGGKRSKLTVNVESFQFIGGRDDAGGGDRSHSNAQRPASVPGQKFSPANKPPQHSAPPPVKPFGDEQHFTDADIPFAAARD